MEDILGLKVPCSPGAIRAAINACRDIFGNLESARAVVHYADGRGVEVYVFDRGKWERGSLSRSDVVS